jgi:hypothetical protein
MCNKPPTLTSCRYCGILLDTQSTTPYEVPGYDTYHSVERCRDRLWRYKTGFEQLVSLQEQGPGPVPMILHCPECRARHVDEGLFATKPHHTHACQSCGFTWRPAIVHTVGVQFLPGFKNP